MRIVIPPVRYIVLGVLILLVVGAVGFAMYWDWHVRDINSRGYCLTPPPFTGTFIEKGRVVDELSQRPIIGAQITFDIMNPRTTSICDDVDLNNVDRTQQVVLSDENGEFAVPFGTSEGGTISMSVSAAGCETLKLGLGLILYSYEFHDLYTLTPLKTFEMKC